MIARQHPGETGCEPYAVGLLDRLLMAFVNEDEVAKRLLEKFTFHIVIQVASRLHLGCILDRGEGEGGGGGGEGEGESSCISAVLGPPVREVGGVTAHSVLALQMNPDGSAMGHQVREVLETARRRLARSLARSPHTLLAPSSSAAHQLHRLEP